jgi:hypothetical protein
MVVLALTLVRPNHDVGTRLIDTVSPKGASVSAVTVPLLDRSVGHSDVPGGLPRAMHFPPNARHGTTRQPEMSIVNREVRTRRQELVQCDADP